MTYRVCLHCTGEALSGGDLCWEHEQEMLTELGRDIAADLAADLTAAVETNARILARKEGSES
jgi:hypothetical protein